MLLWVDGDTGCLLANHVGIENDHSNLSGSVGVLSLTCWNASKALMISPALATRRREGFTHSTMPSAAGVFFGEGGDPIDSHGGMIDIAANTADPPD
jgi:hypothetical protein